MAQPVPPSEPASEPAEHSGPQRTARSVMQAFSAIIVVVILLVVVLVAVGIKTAHKSKKGPSISHQFLSVRVFQKGEPALFGSLLVNAKDITRNYTPEDASKKATGDKELVVVPVSVTNSSKSSIKLQPTDFTLATNDELSYQPGFAPPPTTALTATDLTSGSTVSGELVYSIKKGAQGLMLSYRGYDYNPATKRNEYVTYKLTL